MREKITTCYALLGALTVTPVTIINYNEKWKRTIKLLDHILATLQELDRAIEDLRNE